MVFSMKARLASLLSIEPPAKRDSHGRDCMRKVHSGLNKAINGPLPMGIPGRRRQDSFGFLCR